MPERVWSRRGRLGGPRGGVRGSAPAPENRTGNEEELAPMEERERRGGRGGARGGDHRLLDRDAVIA